MAPQESNVPSIKHVSQVDELFSLCLPKKRKKNRKRKKANDIQLISNEQQQKKLRTDIEVITLDSDDSQCRSQNLDDDVIVIDNQSDIVDLSGSDNTVPDAIENGNDNIVLNINQPQRIEQFLSSEVYVSSDTLLLPSISEPIPIADYDESDPQYEAILNQAAQIIDHPKSWTKDMIDYYTSPCERYRNFDCEKILKTMKSNPNDWYISPADRYGISKRKKSYVQCYKCNRTGHTERECKKNNVCYICGQFNHTYFRCPNTMCLTCGKRTSKNITSCSNCQVFVDCKKSCTLCGQMYHSERLCPSKWRQFSILTDSIEPVKHNARKFCYNCAERGHFGFECPLEPYSDYPLENPIITSFPNHQLPATGSDYVNNNNCRNAVIPLSLETTNLLKTEEGNLFLKQFADDQNTRIEFCLGVRNNYLKINGEKPDVNRFRLLLNEWKIQTTTTAATRT